MERPLYTMPSICLFHSQHPASLESFPTAHQQQKRQYISVALLRLSIGLSIWTRKGGVSSGDSPNAATCFPLVVSNPLGTLKNKDEPPRKNSIIFGLLCFKGNPHQSTRSASLSYPPPPCTGLLTCLAKTKAETKHENRKKAKRSPIKQEENDGISAPCLPMFFKKTTRRTGQNCPNLLVLSWECGNEPRHSLKGNHQLDGS